MTSTIAEREPIERLSAGCARSRRARRPSAEAGSGTSWYSAPSAVT